MLGIVSLWVPCNHNINLGLYIRIFIFFGSKGTLCKKLNCCFYFVCVFYSDFFSSANSGKGRNKAMLQALTGLQFQLRGKLQDQKWTDKHPQEEAHAHYSECHMPVSQYPGFNGFFPVGTHFSSDKAPAISEVPILPTDIYKADFCMLCYLQKGILNCNIISSFQSACKWDPGGKWGVKLMELTSKIPKKYIGLKQANAGALTNQVLSPCCLKKCSLSL